MIKQIAIITGGTLIVISAGFYVAYNNNPGLEVTQPQIPNPNPSAPNPILIPSTYLTPNLYPTPSSVDNIIVTGKLRVIYGDPPPDSGQPSQTRYMITDNLGKDWKLSFGDYNPSGGILFYNNQKVEIKGKQISPNSLSVESIKIVN